MGCITPSSMGGGLAVSLSHSCGFGGSPGSTTVKFEGGDQGISAPGLSLTAIQAVGVGAKIRQMVPIRYNLDQSQGSTSLSVTFQDYLPLKLSRTFIALNDPDVNVPGGQCVRALGTIHHKPAGAPGAVDETTVRRGPAPKIKEGNSWKKLGEEYVFYTGGQLAAAAGNMIGPQLRGVVAGAGNLLNQTGSLLSIIQGIASEQMVELYADDRGRVEVKPKGGGGGGGFGNCELISKSSSEDISCTSAEGGYAIYKHKDQWRNKKKQRFKGIDLLGLPFDNCEGEEVNLYKKDMDGDYRKQMERALKIAYLDGIWPNWQGYMTYVYLKRSAQEAKDAASDDELDIIKYSHYNKKDHGKDLREKVSVRNCKKVTTVPLKLNKDAAKNEIIDKIYKCIKPLIFDTEDFEDDIKANFKQNFGQGDTKSVVDKLPDDVIQYFALEGYKKLECEENDIIEAGSGPDVEIGEGDDVQGSLAQYSSMLKDLAKTVGRYYVMSGGGQGGGGGSLTERQHNLRKYKLEAGGTLIWYHPDLDVRETVFSNIYTAIYEKKMEGKDALSVGQFLALAAKEKRSAMRGKGGGPPPRGKGKNSSDIRGEAKKIEEQCNNNEPKGIVIWDRQYEDIGIPDQEQEFKYIGVGAESHNDRYTNDILRYIFEQVKVSIIANPCKDQGVQEGKDCIDIKLDEWKPHEDWKVSKRKSENLEYTVLEDRKYNNSRAKYPPCDSAMSVSIGFEDISGKVIWRDVDCYGNVQEFEHPFREGGAVNAALSRAVNKMYNVKLDKCGTSTYTTCGQVVANMPGGGATQDYSVQIGEDGSVTTTFTVGGAEAALAGANLRQHKANPQPQHSTGVSIFVPNSPNPTPGRSFRNVT